MVGRVRSDRLPPTTLWEEPGRLLDRNGAHTPRVGERENGLSRATALRNFGFPWISVDSPS